MDRLNALALALPLALAPVLAQAEPVAPAPPSPTRAQAPESARCMLKVIAALPGEGGIDPNITVLRSKLERPPFRSWHNFKLVSKQEEELKEGGTATYPAPKGVVNVSYVGHEVRPNGKHAVRGVLAIDATRHHVKTGFTLDEGGHFLAAGEQYEGGILIYALSCKTEK